MPVKNRELGRVVVDAGDVVVFSMDAVMRLAEKLKVSEDALIARYDGVACDFHADGTYGVDRLFAITKEGKTYPVVMIGGEPDNFLRFLGAGEQSFHDFYESHPRKAEVGEGEAFNRVIFEEIAAEYRKKLVGNGSVLRSVLGRTPGGTCRQAQGNPGSRIAGLYPFGHLTQYTQERNMKAQLPSISSYGQYSSDNYGAHTLLVDVGPLRVWFSYKTPVAFHVDGQRRVVLRNYWAATTGKHLNWIDGGDKKSRVDQETFDNLWVQHVDPLFNEPKPAEPGIFANLTPLLDE